jgi:hypothetical protein
MNTKHLKSALAAVMMLFCLQASAQMEFIEKYEDNKKATYVYVGKAMLKLVGTNKFAAPGGRDLSAIADKLNSMQIVSSEDKQTSDKLKADVAETVKKHKFDILVKASDEGSKVTIYFMEGKAENYVLIAANEDNETNVIAISGTFTYEDMEKMSRNSAESSSNSPSEETPPITSVQKMPTVFRLVDSKDVELRDDFWSRWQKKADSVTSTATKQWPWQEIRTQIPTANRIAAWEAMLPKQDFTGMCWPNDFDNKTSTVIKILMPMLRENLELAMLTGESRYFDMAEKLLANHILHLYIFDRAWNTPDTELNSLIYNVGSMAYGVSNSDVYVNMFMHSNVNISNDSIDLRMQVENNSPWENETTISFANGKATDNKEFDMTLHIRVPFWVNGQDVILPRFKAKAINKAPSFVLNNQEFTPEYKDGYAVIKRHWSKDDVLTVKMPNPILQISDVERPKMIAWQRGPLIYNVHSLFKNTVFDQTVPLKEGREKYIEGVVLKGKQVNKYGQLNALCVPYYESGGIGLPSGHDLFAPTN